MLYITIRKAKRECWESFLQGLEELNLEENTA